ncbi:MAG: HNH endonuclease [Nitrospinota bacterium]
MIDACHIIPFSESYDDTITNGIALCPNLHRAFDRGLISIDNNYKVMVSKKIIETNSKYSLKQFKGKKILLPKEIRFYLKLANIEWHRNFHKDILF